MRITPNWFKRMVVRMAKAYDPRYTAAIVQDYMSNGKAPVVDFKKNFEAIKYS